MRKIEKGKKEKKNVREVDDKLVRKIRRRGRRDRGGGKREIDLLFFLRKNEFEIINYHRNKYKLY